MTANEYLDRNARAELGYARSQYHDCRRKGLRVMTEHFRRQMVRAYMTMRSIRGAEE